MNPRPYDPPRTRVVALGGGHGLAATLSALRRLPVDITAVVTVADDGGSSGRLRRELGVLPPGDLRMALAALCGDDRWGRLWADVLQHRFESEGELHQHAVGNLLIVALWELLGDHVGGLDVVGELLDSRGRVLPMCSIPLNIEADVEQPGGIEVVRGQVEVATTPGHVRNVRLDPEAPPATPEVVEAIDAADWVILGPGSWFTSVIPHLLVPDIRTALDASSARSIVVLNLTDQPGETEGFSTVDHLAALERQAPGLTIDVVLGDHRHGTELTEAHLSAFGAEPVLAHVASRTSKARHDPLLLAAAFRSIFSRG